MSQLAICGQSINFIDSQNNTAIIKVVREQMTCNCGVTVFDFCQFKVKRKEAIRFLPALSVHFGERG